MEKVMKTMTVEEYIEYMGDETTCTIPQLYEYFQWYPDKESFEMDGKFNPKTREPERVRVTIAHVKSIWRAMG